MRMGTKFGCERDTEERRVKGMCTAESRVGRGYRFAAAC